MARCFISYDTSDRVMVEGLAKDVRKHRHEVWIDFESIPGGARWETEITNAIEKADVCVITLTPESIQSQWVKKEIVIAQEKNTPIIPIIMHKIPLPEGLETLGIAHLQCIDFDRYGYATGLERLLKAFPVPETFLSPAIIQTGLRALIVEDIPAQQLAVKQVLEMAGFEITLAADFDSALTCIRDKQFDLITLDMQLEELDTGGQHGIILLNQTRTYQKGVPVIIISALDWSGSQVRNFLRKYGAFDYLKKPFDPEELLSIIQDALKQHG